ncbi:hypothetical protein OHB54_44100 [Streptomyces sp. NBC_01007]|nr:hypothetical protein OHB54_44100 [Streptomyces sp. NBC_01007]
MQPSAHTATGQAHADSPGDAPPVGARPVRRPVDGLEARMAAVKDDMDARLALAAVAYEVNTAHIDTAPVDWSRIAAPMAPTAPLPAPGPYATPIAALLHRASLRLQEGGWCAGALIDEDGSLCSQGAIRMESGGDRSLEAQALEVLLDAIRRRFGPHVESVPSFNDAWANGREPTRMMEQACVLADARGL